MSTASFHQFNHAPASPSGLDILAESSEYALGKSPRNPSLSGKNEHSINGASGDGDFSQRDHLVDSASRKRLSMEPASAPVRRRISRACDQCNQLRTKCDGKNPCAHCVEFGLACEYARARKKRGKASKKDLAAAAAAVATTGAANPSSDLDTDTDRVNNGVVAREQNSQDGFSSRETTTTFDAARNANVPAQSHLQSSEIPGMVGMQNSNHVQQGAQAQHQQTHLGATVDGLQGTLNDSSRPMSVSDLRPLQMLHPSNTNPRSPSTNMLPPNGFSYPESAYPLMNPQEPNPSSLNHFRLAGSAENPSAPFMGLSPAPSPGWLPLPPPSPANFPSFSMHPFPSSLRYPVLQPVLPHIASIIPQSLACDLMDVYFTSSSSSHISPQSPYVVGYVFRKQSFLHPTKPRVCSPALLASMLWVAAQTSDAAFLTSPPSARGRICQKLLELTVGLLRPLIHGPAAGETSPNYAANMVINGVALGGFGVSMDQLGAQSSATGAVDDVATYVHLATVVSASEYKAASMRWWTAAWALARELRLGRELPPNGPNSRQDGEGRDGDMAENAQQQPSLVTTMGNGVDITEEEREERRRIWWLLYATDRHLALCYNRPLTLLDTECSRLLQPMNDDLWQAGDFTNDTYRTPGPPLECTGHSMFGYFLPLMTILGEIVDLQHARNHPRFGPTFRNSNECNAQMIEITRQLDGYSCSLKEFEARYTSNLVLGTESEPTAVDGTHLDHVSPSGRSSSSAVGTRVSESIVHTKTVVAYGTHIMHVLHILLAGKWDPVNLLDDNDLWISSDSFISALGHAVRGAEAVADILEYDPDLSFMPFFFGIYLLQGSFLLLLTADKLQGDASASVVRACEIIVRAHEACVVTLNTEYQRNFRKVMRSALAQVRGRVPEDFGEQQQRRRDVLSLYRWSGDGGGLAL